jgi:serine/threonine protein kinase/WD40 repeat protein
VARLLEGYLQQLEQGAPLRPDEWRAQHPELGGPVEEYLATLDLLHQTALGLRGLSSPEAAPAPQGPALGQLGDYRLLREIARGGMGVVYEAEQLSLGRRVALKVLPLAGALDPRQLRRFHNEALAASGLHHPSIVDVFGAGCERGVHYYAMRHIEGQTLAEAITRMRSAFGPAPEGGRSPDPETVRGLPCPPRPLTSSLDFRAAAAIGAQVAEALDYSHEHGVVHRDVKPSNVMLDARGWAWLTDFGLAHLQRQVHLTQSGDLLGTLRYMSPEQALAKREVLDHRTDIYALGATLYELLTLRPAVPGDDQQEVLRRIAFEEPARPSLLNRAIPPDLEAIVLKAMARTPEERYGTAQELAEDLRRFVNDQPVQARRPTRLQQASKWARRHRRPLLAAAVAAIVMLTLAVIVLAVRHVQIRQFLAARDQALSDLQAQERQTRAAERAKTLELALSRWNEARVFHRSRQPGQRHRSLEALTEAVRHLRSLDLLESNTLELPKDATAGLEPPGDGEAGGVSVKLALRNDAIACLGLWDVREVKRLHLPWPACLLSRFDSLGTHYVSYDEPNAVTVRCVEDNRVVERWSWQGAPCVGLVLSPDDRFLAAFCRQEGAEETVCRVWDRVTGQRVVERKVARGHGSGVHAFRPASQVLALAQPDGSIALCELSKGQDLAVLPRGQAPAFLRFDPSGRYLAASFMTEPGVQIWDLVSGQVLPKWSGAWGPGGGLAWSPDGTVLALAHRAAIELCEFPSGKCRAVLRGHENIVTGVEFHPSGRLLASTSHDDTIRLWHFASDRELVIPGERSARFSPDGRRLATAGYQGIALWELADPRDCLHQLPHGDRPSSPPRALSFAPDGRLLASASPDGALLWDAAAARLIGPIPSGDGPWLAFHAGGGRLGLLTTGPGGVMQWPITPDGAGRALRVGPGTILQATTAPGESLRADLAGSAPWLLLGTGYQDLDRVPLGGPGGARRLGSHDRVTWVALSPDGRWAVSVASTGDDPSFCLWDVSRGALVGPLPHEGDYKVAAFSPDGRWLVTSSRGEFRFWEVGTWELKLCLSRHPLGLRGPVAFSRDGRLMALPHARHLIHLIDLRDVATPKHLATLELPPGLRDIAGLSLSPDGTRLAADTEANLLCLWDLRRLREGLAALDLDWEMPPYPPPQDEAQVVEALRMEMRPADDTGRVSDPRNAANPTGSGARPW